MFNSFGLPAGILLIFLTIVLTHGIENRSNLARNNQNDDFIPDENDCIENRIEALDLGRQCSRRCRKDAPCENTRKQCLCDGLCGMSCIKPDLNCHELQNITNGDFLPKSTRFGTKVTYSCATGYYLFGSRERLCQGDEDWSGQPAECLSDPHCRNPSKVNHARNPSDGTYRLGDKVNYSCYPGYQPHGNPEASCQLIEPNQTAWQWSGVSFRCIPRSCGDPGQIENGKRHGDSFIIASSVSYSCNEGYEMIGQSRRYCQSDNQWSGQPPQCEPITCKPTDHLENGKINYAYPLVFNSTVEYSCDYGFRLNGPRRRVCGLEGKLLDEAPTCAEIKCPDLVSLPNGYIRGYSVRMGEKKEFICKNGTRFVGDHRETVCMESGEWSNPPPKCLAPCTVPNVPHSSSIFAIEFNLMTTNVTENITLNEADVGSKVEHGYMLEIFCENNYELDEHVDSENIIRGPICNNSTWSYEAQCKPASCRGSPPNPSFGRVRLISIAHGSVGHIYCQDGYRLVGDKAVQCVKGNWTVANSTCEETYCKFPGKLQYGRVLLVGLTGMYDYQPYIKHVSNGRQIAYECDVGYKISDGYANGATCMDGNWRPGGLPSCVKE